MAKFRCPHRPWKTTGAEGDKTRSEKAAARTKLYVVPADTEWREVPEEYSRGKEHDPRYANDAPFHWEAEVTCPDCGDTITIKTGTEPTAEPEPEPSEPAEQTSEA